MSIDFYQASEKLMEFIDKSPSPFHAVEASIERLEKNGFVPLREEDSWPSPLPEKFYVIRGGSTLAAFVAPPKAQLEKGFLLIGAHTDSPCLRLRNQGEFSAHGYQQWGVEVYGGAIHHTWTDIDLGVAGRVILKGNQHRSVLVQSKQPLMRVANLAIHLDREANKGKTFNPQTELIPIAGLEDKEPSLLKVLCDEVNIDFKDVMTTELSLYNFQPSSFLGVDREFISAPRLDNLAMCDAALFGLTSSVNESLDQVKGLFLFDHEECGSHSAQGAASNFMTSLITRLSACYGADQAQTLQAQSNSFFISADMAHAVHPNYPTKHDSLYLPKMNGGPVIKANANMRYATDACSSASFMGLCEKENVPYQSFINRNDMGCGSTIGPIAAAQLGLKTIDVGAAQLSMHSAREMGGSQDPEWMNRIFTSFYQSGVEDV